LAKGQPEPEWVTAEPDLFPGDDFFISAFYQLSSCRQDKGDIPGPIPWTAIVEYADRRGLYNETSLLLEMIIREMDNAYIKWYTRKQKALVPKGKKNGKL